MSKCVVRMEMPNGCHDCRLRNMVGNCPIPMFDGQDEKKSGIIGRIWTLEERLQRPPWCPIICQLPEGHGRLIDADAAYKAACEGADNWDGGCSPYRDDCIREEMDKVPTASPWHRVEEELPEPNVQCLVRDDDNNCAVGYYRQDARAWDSPFFGWVERDDEYYEDGDLCRIGKVVAWMPLPEPPKEDA